jgi:hypothetical protein
MSPVLRIFVSILTFLALAMGGCDVIANGVRTEIALPCSLAFIIGAIILLFAKAQKQ